MILNQFHHRGAWLLLLPVGLLLAVPGFFYASSSAGDEIKMRFLPGFLLLAGVLWVLAQAFQVALIYHREANLLQWSYRVLGAQYASKEVALSEVLATGLRYWRSKYVYYEPVVALANGKLLPIGRLESAYSLMGENDQAPFQAARRQAESLSKTLGVQCLASDPDTTVQIIGGQAVAAANSRQSQLTLNRLVIFLVGMAFVVAVLFAFARG